MTVLTYSNTLSSAADKRQVRAATRPAAQLRFSAAIDQLAAGLVTLSAVGAVGALFWFF
jgi:hypothetical protein